MLHPPAVDICKLNFGYRLDQRVLRNVDLRLSQGSFSAIIGPNGGGKTTLGRIILGLLSPVSGSILVYGKRPSVQRMRMAYVPQFAGFRKDFPITVADMVLKGRMRPGVFFRFSAQDVERRDEVLEQLMLSDLAGRPIQSLSGGQLQRCLLARALVSNPELLLLDEPTASVDPSREQDIFSLLGELKGKITQIVISHDYAFVSKYVDKVVCVNGSVKSYSRDEMGAGELAELYGPHSLHLKHQTTEV